MPGPVRSVLPNQRPVVTLSSSETLSIKSGTCRRSSRLQQRQARGTPIYGPKRSSKVLFSLPSQTRRHHHATPAASLKDTNQNSIKASCLRQTHRKIPLKMQMRLPFSRTALDLNKMSRRRRVSQLRKRSHRQLSRLWVG